jgi:hypothetical protein
MRIYLAACIADYGKGQQTLGVQLYTVRDIRAEAPTEDLAHDLPRSVIAKSKCYVRKSNRLHHI